MLNFRWRINCLFFAAFLWFSLPIADASSWETDALRLSGESGRVYQQSLNRLRSTGHLNEQLEAALHENSTRTFLALDVISALKLKKLLPVVVKLSAQDRSGFFYLALNSFFDREDSQALAELYQERLRSQGVSPTVKMVLLDTLGRIRSPIPSAELKSFLQDKGQPELRSASLYYLRSSLLTGDSRYRILFEELKTAPPVLTSDDLFANQFHALSLEVK